MTAVTRQRIAYIVSDYLTVSVGWLCFNLVRYFSLPEDFRFDLGDWLMTPAPLAGQFLVPLMLSGFYWVTGYYNHVFYKSRLAELGNTAMVSLVAMLVIYFTVLIDDNIPERMQNYELLGVLWLSMFLPTYISRLLITRRVIKRIRRGELAFNVLVVGADRKAMELAARLDGFLSHMGMRVVGYVDIDDRAESRTGLDRPVYNSVDLQRITPEKKITAFIVLPQEGGMHETVDSVNHLFPLGKTIYITPDIQHALVGGAKMESLVGEPLINVSSAAITPATANIKRLIDVVGSALALIVLSPLLLVVSAAVRIDSPGPVFYRQERIGYRKKPFRIIKFRTMRTDAEAEGPCLSEVNDPRITRVGRILRKYRIDEFPQFWNVLTGEMSLVGPRPERAFYVKQIVERAPYYSLVHQVRPGITSLGMVKFGYASTVDQMVQRLRYDLLYLENISIGTDLKILIHTVTTVVTGKGI